MRSSFSHAPQFSGHPGSRDSKRIPLRFAEVVPFILSEHREQRYGDVGTVEKRDDSVPARLSSSRLPETQLPATACPLDENSVGRIGCNVINQSLPFFI